MDIQSAFNSSVYGLNQASQGISQNAQEIASRSLPTAAEEEQNAQTDLAEQENADRANNAEQQDQLNAQAEQDRQQEVTDNLIDLNQNQLEASANIKALQTANETIGSIIDIKV